MRCKPSLDGVWFSLYLEIYGQTDFPTWCVPSTYEVWIMWLCFESLKCSISGPGDMVLWYIKWYPFFGSLVSVCMELHRGYHGGLLGRGVVSSRIACNGVFLMICFLLLFIYGDTQVCFITITFWLFLLHAFPKWFTPILDVCGKCMVSILMVLDF